MVTVTVKKRNEVVVSWGWFALRMIINLKFETLDWNIMRTNCDGNKFDDDNLMFWNWMWQIEEFMWLIDRFQCFMHKEQMIKKHDFLKNVEKLKRITIQNFDQKLIVVKLKQKKYSDVLIIR